MSRGVRHCNAQWNSKDYVEGNKNDIAHSQHFYERQWKQGHCSWDERDNCLLDPATYNWSLKMIFNNVFKETFDTLVSSTSLALALRQSIQAVVVNIWEMQVDMLPGIDLKVIKDMDMWFCTCYIVQQVYAQWFLKNKQQRTLCTTVYMHRHFINAVDWKCCSFALPLLNWRCGSHWDSNQNLKTWRSGNTEKLLSFLLQCCSTIQ